MEVLLLIDPQVDFCEGGALGVPGGRQALTNVGSFIDCRGEKLDDIVRTFDQHHRRHIAHPHEYRLCSNGQIPDPFNALQEENGEILIGTLDDKGFHPFGKVRRRLPDDTAWTLRYLKELRTGDRYPHMLWPPHCIIGTPGACARPEIVQSVANWEDEYAAVSPAIAKGSGIRSEHFGALRAEVIDPEDESTQTNPYLLALLQNPRVTRIYLAGLARGHCLANTAMDVDKEFGGDEFCQKCVLLTNGTADVENMDWLGDKFVDNFVGRGMKTALTTDF